MFNFFVVLFKNKERKKIIKKFVTFNKANSFYNKLLENSSEIIFDKKYENGKECEYELGLVQIGTSKEQTPVYITDDMGRNIKVKLEDDEYSLIKISRYKQEELIFDINKNEKLSVKMFIKKYLKSDTLKVVSLLNNKIIVQKDEDIKLFSLKNEDDSMRFVESLSNYFLKNKRSDCLFIKDDSTPQRKYLLNLLSNSGYDKKILYRKFTTFPRQG